MNTLKSRWVDITEICNDYLPISKKKARRFVSLYLNPIKIGNRIFVERSKLEQSLSGATRDYYPLNSSD